MPSFTNTFGGTVIYPADVSYRAVALTENVTLTWPTELATNTNVVSSIMDVTPSGAGFTIRMPDATQASVGQTALFFNVGASSFTVADNSGNTIQTIASGQAWQIYLTDNTTVNGTWRPIQYGAGTSSASASALAGAGLKAITTTLNQSAPTTLLSANYTLTSSDRARVIVWNGGAGTFTMPSASTAGNDWFFDSRNSGTGGLTIQPAGGELINGQANLVFNPGDSARIITDGINFYTIGYGQSSTFAFDYVSISLTGQTSPYTLSGTNLNRIAYQFSGILTANMEIIVPNTIQQYWIRNTTTGSYTLTVKTSGGTGVIIVQNGASILYCDGTNVVQAETANLSVPVAIAQGGTGATNAGSALVNLGGTSLGIGIFTATNGATARASIGAAASGANADITSLSGLTTPLSVPQGGTGLTTVPSNGRLLIGNGTNYTLANLTAGAGLSITNGAGSITIDSTGVTAYPGAGIPLSTGSAWGTSYATSGTGTTIALTVSPALTGTPTAPTATAGTNTTQIATTAYVVGTAFSAALPGQGGNAGKFVTTDGTTASWSFVPLTSGVSGILPVANGGTGASDAATALTNLGAYPAANPSGFTSNTGTVTSVSGTGTVNGITLTGTVTTSGSLTLGGTLSGVDLTSQITGTLPVANGGTGASTAGAALTSLGATTIGGNIFTLTNPSAVTFPQFNADNTVSALDAATFRAAIGAGTSSSTGTVTSVSGTGTVNGITLTGTVTTSGSLTLGGTLSGVDLTTQVTGILPVANGGTGASTLAANNVLLGNGTSAVATVAPGTSGNILTSDGTTWTSAAAPSSAVQYPQNSQSANYTLVLGDAGKQIFHPASDANVRTYTIPANASVPFPIGTVVLFTVENGGASVSVAINSDTLVLGSGVTGTAPVSPNNTLMAIKVTATKWMANYLTQDVPIAPYVFAIASTDAVSFTQWITAYPWTSGVGFGTQYANPTTAVSFSTSDIDFSPNGSALVVSGNSTPFLNAYRWSGNGFGSKYSDPATLPAGNTVGVVFSSQGNAIASVNGSSSPNLEAWRWDSGTGFGTKYSNPATVTFTSTRSVTFHPLDTAIAVTNSNSPFINAYAWTSASGFGTKFSNPATLPPSGPLGPAPKSIAFNPAGDALAMANLASPYISVYAWSGAGFGTRFSNPATLPGSTGYSVVFSPAGDAIAFLGGGSPGIYVYPWSASGFGTKYADPGTLLNAGLNLAFSPNGDTICAAMSGSPYIRAYPWSSATGFGTVYTEPSTIPPGVGNAIASTYNF